jgi:hypothetical protein
MLRLDACRWRESKLANQAGSSQIERVKKEKRFSFFLVPSFKAIKGPPAPSFKQQINGLTELLRRNTVQWNLSFFYAWPRTQNC